MQTELYEFAMSTSTYRYTSASEDVSAWGLTFTAAPIGRAALETSDDLNRSGLAISAMANLPYVAAALGNYQYGTVTVYAWNGDTEAWDTVWSGRVVNITLSGPEAQIATESILTAPRRLGLSGKFQTMCRHVLYGSGCGLDKDAMVDPDYLWRFDGTVSLVSGYAVTVPGLNAKASGTYTYGVAVFGALGSALITDHTGDVITLLSLIPGLAAASAATVYAGCDRLNETCRDRFGDLLNFGGYPWLPLHAVKGHIPLLGKKDR